MKGWFFNKHSILNFKQTCETMQFEYEEEKKNSIKWIL